MKVGKIPVGMDPIEAKKKVCSFLRSVQNDSKPDKCILCGQPKTSFCNSHSVPRMCLKNIAVDEVQALSEDEQKEFAEVCYMRCASFFNRVKQDFDIYNINCSMYKGDGTSFAFFSQAYVNSLPPLSYLFRPKNFLNQVLSTIFVSSSGNTNLR